VIITSDARSFAVLSDDTVMAALAKIQENRHRTVFCVSAHGVLEGVATDGDIRRWLIGTPDLDLQVSIGTVANRHPVTASADLDPADVRALLVPPIGVVPLVDDRGRLVAVAIDGADEVRIGAMAIGEGHPCAVIAEIGINHNGSVDEARRLVDAAAAAGADAAKLQLRDMASLYRAGAGSADVREDLGAQYTMQLLERFNLSAAQLAVVFDHCRDVGITPLCTPWDERSVDALEDLGMEGYKLASADLTNHGLIRHIGATRKPLIASTGMSAESEIREAVDVLRHAGSPYVLLHCNSTYPAPFKDVNLRYIERLRQIGGGCPVGYSGHERGWSVAVAAVALGAQVIEKHLTSDRDQEGVDHKVSLLPGELAAMVTAIREVEEARGEGGERRPTQGEAMNRVTLAKSLVAAIDLEPGDPITDDAVDVRSPGRGLQPNRRAELVGQVATRRIAAGDFFYAGDLPAGRAQPRAYAFSRPWGLPVRYHDAVTLPAPSNPDFLEFHFSYKDLDEDPAAHLGATDALGLVVHSPDLFAGDHILNLASDDPDYRARSEAELRRVVDVTLGLRERFPRTARPLVIVSPGGFSSSAPLPEADRPAMYDRVAESFARVADPDVEIIAQTLPPFPWYLGGQLYCNLFVDAEDTARFAVDSGHRLCLDVSHSKLAANHRRRPFSEVVELLAPHTAHLHLVDAVGVDGEGIQVGEGEIDWVALADQLARLCPDAGFIPEIWMGHKDGGEGFWVANERLEAWF
jgi:sialic acid synthase SpsE/sugar phosphate isomerase/epimerase